MSIQSANVSSKEHLLSVTPSITSVPLCSLWLKTPLQVS
jgi:hypothetical protein